MANTIADIKKLIEKQVGKIVKPDFQKIIQEKFDELKKQLIQDFLAHPVTQEIMAGPNSENLSNTLGGKGNLFSFIGFDSSDDPINPILDMLQNITLSFDSEIPSGVKFSINFPSAQDIFNVTPMPWASGRSWSKGIESGISGLGFYLYKKSQESRSGEAIQTKVKLSSNLKFKNTSYISALLANYKEKFSKIK
jgi:hypothetical protein